MNYAIIENNRIINVAVCDDPDWAHEQGWIDPATLPEGAWIGWENDGQGNWIAPS